MSLYMARVGVCLLYTKEKCIFPKSFCSLPLYSISQPCIKIGLIKRADSFSDKFFGRNLPSDGVV